MSMSKKMQNKIFFAKFCLNNPEVTPVEVAELIVAIQRRVATATNESNIPNYPERKDNAARKAVEQKAVKMGWYVKDWPGLFPSIHRKSDNFPIHLPYDNS